MTQEGGPKVREERVPPIRPRREFDSLGIPACVNVPSLVPVHLRRETVLHTVKLRVERAFLDPEARERAGDDLSDQRPRSLLKRDLCGCAGDTR